MNLSQPTSWSTGLVALLVLTGSAWVVAQGVDRLEIEPAYGDLLSDEIYRQADNWRAPPAFESEWRAPAPKPKTRMTLGYDSVFEAQRAREAAGAPRRSVDLGEPTPNTLFRLEF